MRLIARGLLRLAAYVSLWRPARTGREEPGPTAVVRDGALETYPLW
jgi:hypothetical protein